MDLGTKIRQIRELRGLSQENMASELGMSVTGYGKIERNEVSVNFEKLEQISKIFGMHVENVIGFDDKIAFNNYNNKINQQIATYSMPIEMKQLYEDKIALLEDKVKYLEKQLAQKK
jgi:transcriptional regulator with XRE-family HTH domain